jgi:transcriptional regulator with XRE-family HTH domain
MEVKQVQKQIGRRIAAMRKIKGLSQVDLANSVKISRPSLTQIELGNRRIDVIELHNLSRVLGFSIDDLLSDEYDNNQKLIFDNSIKLKTSEERVSAPTLQVGKFKNVLLYILEQCAGKPNVGETVLYKLLYFSDFNYYEIYETHLTGACYRKSPFGPVPQNFETIIQQMTDEGQLQRVKTQYHGHHQTRFIPLENADLTVLWASEKDIVDKVIEQMSDWSDAMISDYSQGDKPWKATDINDFIDYELVFYRRVPYSVRVYQEDEKGIF